MLNVPEIEITTEKAFAKRFPTLVLASASPNRKALLEKCGCIVIQRPQDIDEVLDNADPHESIAHIALAKMKAYLISKDKEPDLPSLCCDTMVLFDHQALGKPINRLDAERMIRAFSGKTQEVVTGIALTLPGRTTISGFDVSRVTFNLLSEDEIERYIASGEWQGAAGAYRIQKTGYRLIKQIDGSWSNVVGLPLEKILSLAQ